MSSKDIKKLNASKSKLTELKKRYLERQKRLNKSRGASKRFDGGNDPVNLDMYPRDEYGNIDLSDPNVQPQAFDGFIVGTGPDVSGGNGTAVDTFVFPEGAAETAGVAFQHVVDGDTNSLTLPHGGVLVFTGSAPQGDVNVRFKFENNPDGDTEPYFETSLVTISSAAGEQQYLQNLPSQGTNTFDNIILYLNERDVPVELKDFVIYKNYIAPSSGYWGTGFRQIAASLNDGSEDRDITIIGLSATANDFTLEWQSPRLSIIDNGVTKEVEVSLHSNDDGTFSHFSFEENGLENLITFQTAPTTDFSWFYDGTLDGDAEAPGVPERDLLLFAGHSNSWELFYSFIPGDISDPSDTSDTSSWGTEQMDDTHISELYNELLEIKNFASDMSIYGESIPHRLQVINNILSLYQGDTYDFNGIKKVMDEIITGLRFLSEDNGTQVTDSNGISGSLDISTPHVLTNALKNLQDGLNALDITVPDLQSQIDTLTLQAEDLVHQISGHAAEISDLNTVHDGEISALDTQIQESKVVDVSINPGWNLIGFHKPGKLTYNSAVVNSRFVYPKRDDIVSNNPSDMYTYVEEVGGEFHLENKGYWLYGTLAGGNLIFTENDEE